jgi:hypothetical protein
MENDWHDIAMSTWSNRELTDYIIEEKRKRVEKPFMPVESYDFIILLAGEK